MTAVHTRPPARGRRGAAGTQTVAHRDATGVRHPGSCGDAMRKPVVNAAGTRLLCHGYARVYVSPATTVIP